LFVPGLASVYDWDPVGLDTDEWGMRNNIFYIPIVDGMPIAV